MVAPQSLLYTKSQETGTLTASHRKDNVLDVKKSTRHVPIVYASEPL